MNDIRVLIEGGLNLLLGKPGCGKSLLAAAMAADVSKGREPVTAAPRPPGRVCFVAEDHDWTVVRRLQAAGADLGRIMLFASRRRLRRLSELAEAAGDVSLVILDPVTAVQPTRDELAVILAWAKAKGVTVAATVPEAASGVFLDLAGAAFLVSRSIHGRRSLLPLKHPALTRAMPFFIGRTGAADGAEPRAAWRAA